MEKINDSNVKATLVYGCIFLGIIAAVLLFFFLLSNPKIFSSLL